VDPRRASGRGIGTRVTGDERILAVFEATEVELRACYGAQQPMHYGTILRWQDGGPDPLDGVSIYWHPDGHWHYVGFGMSERADKQTNNPRVSGWGFELTFRLRAPSDVAASASALGTATPHASTSTVLEVAAAAPTWPIVLLNDLARYVFESRKPLGHGHFIERPGDPRGRFWGIVRDPVLRPVDTVNGAFAWLLVVALEEPAFRALQGEDYERCIEEIARANPFFVSAAPAHLPDQSPR
jgi:suppressor of fused